MISITLSMKVSIITITSISTGKKSKVAQFITIKKDRKCYCFLLALMLLYISVNVQLQRDLSMPVTVLAVCYQEQLKTSTGMHRPCTTLASTTGPPHCSVAQSWTRCVSHALCVCVHLYVCVHACIKPAYVSCMHTCIHIIINIVHVCIHTIRHC